MAMIQPFKALRPQPQLAKQVASQPYDVLSSTEAKQVAAGNPASFLHVTKSEIDLAESVDIHDAAVYEQAKENITAFIKRDVLFRESKDCYYIYQLIMHGRAQSGLVCVSSVDDYENDIIKKHEFTRPEKELDRINHIKTSGAQTGNVFLAYRNNESLDALIENWKKTKTAVYDFVADDQIQHTIWVVNDTSTIDNITAIFNNEIPCTYIADGHHRAASAAKVRAALGANATKNADYFLTTLFPSNQLYIMDYNRVVKDLNGLTPAAFMEAVAVKFNIEQLHKEPFKPAALHELGMYINGCWYKLTAKAGTYTEDPIGVLDVTILSESILAPILNIVDLRKDKRIEFVGGLRGLGELKRRVDSGEMKAAFALYPVTMKQLIDIADNGLIMPPKVTWFEPKLRSGLVINKIK